jgi:hypothetical protein
MNGKKVVFIFSTIVLVSAVAISLWIKQGYESRPQITFVEEEKK